MLTIGGILAAEEIPWRSEFDPALQPKCHVRFGTSQVTAVDRWQVIAIILEMGGSSR